MMTAQFVSGVSLFALLIVDICCLPVQKGYFPSASYGSSYTNADPNFDFYQEVPSGQFPPGAVRPHSAPSNGRSTPSSQAVPQPGPNVPQSTVQRGPAPSVGSSGPVFSESSGTAVKPNPASIAQPGAAFQPGPQGWAVAPPTLFSGGEEMVGTRAVVPSQPDSASPPGSMYQAGELSHYEKSFEHGNSERETEEQGWLPPPPPLPPQPVPMYKSAGQGFTIQPPPNFYTGSWAPYPFYDFMFLTGRYPPGTITHASSSYEQGRDHWQDVHYVRDYDPYNPTPVQQIQTFTGDFVAPESLEDSLAASGQGGAEAVSGQGGAKAVSGQGGAQGGTEPGSGQGGVEAVSGQGGAEAGSGQGGAQAAAEAGSEQGGAQAAAEAGSEQGGAQAAAEAGSEQGGAQAAAEAGSEQGGAQAGAEVSSRQGGAEAGSGHGSVHAGLLPSSYGGFWLPVNHQAGGHNLGKVAY